MEHANKMYPLWTHTVQDMQSDGASIEEIVALERFKAFMSAGCSIDSVHIVELNLDIIEEQKVYPLVCMDVVVQGETFGITVSMEAQELILFINYSTGSPSERNFVQCFFR